SARRETPPGTRSPRGWRAVSPRGPAPGHRERTSRPVASGRTGASGETAAGSPAPGRRSPRAIPGPTPRSCTRRPGRSLHTLRRKALDHAGQRCRLLVVDPSRAGVGEVVDAPILLDGPETQLHRHPVELGSPAGEEGRPSVDHLLVLGEALGLGEPDQ